MRTQDILSPLEHCHGVRTVIVCIGNRLKGDDAAGSILYDRLAGRISANLIDAATVPENYIERIIRKEPRSIIVVDAVDFGQPPGAVGLFEPRQLKSFTTSTHVLSPAMFVQMIQGRIEVDVYFVGIQVGRTELGGAVSPQVSTAVRSLGRFAEQLFPLELRC